MLNNYTKLSIKMGDQPPTHFYGLLNYISKSNDLLRSQFIKDKRFILYLVAFLE